MANSTLVCDEKIYQSGRNIRQLLVDKRYAKEAEMINTRIVNLKQGESVTIPACSFFHFHANALMNVSLNDTLILNCSMFTSDAPLQSVVLEAVKECEVYIVFNAV